LRPVVDGLQAQYGDRIDFKEINFYENRDLAAKYRAQGHPSLAFVDGNNQMTMLLTGVPSKASIEDALQPLLP
jgi:thioredoxin-related protein